MYEDLGVNIDELGGAELGCLVNCAVAVAAADGTTDKDEYQALSQQLGALLGADAETVESLIDLAFKAVASKSREALFQEAGNMLETPGREAAFTIATAVATRSGGIAMKEGLALQSLAKTLGIGYPSARYNELLGKGMRAGRA